MGRYSFGKRTICAGSQEKASTFMALILKIVQQAGVIRQSAGVEHCSAGNLYLEMGSAAG
jgi:hypothetical protein